MKKNVSIFLIAASIVACGCSQTKKTELKSISLSGEYKTQFSIGDTFTYDGLIVTANYSDNTSKTVSDYVVSVPDMTTAGSKVVNVQYTESSISVNESYTIKVNEKSAVVLTSLKLSGTVKTEFLQGEAFTHDGLIVTAVYSDNSTKVVNDYQVSTPDMTVIGLQDVTVSYTDNGVTVKKIYQIDVKEKEGPVTLYSIKLSGEYKTAFKKGDEFTHQGLIVTAVYSDGSENVVTSKAVFSAPNMDVVGNQDVEVSYTEDEVTKSTSYTINITEEDPVVVLSSINLSGAYKVEFLLNETFTYEGLIVTAVYSNGASAVVTGFNVTTPDLSSYGTKEVTVSYAEEDITVTAKYNIKVTDEVDPSIIEAGKKDVREAFNELDIEDYNDTRWLSIINKLNEALKNLDLSLTQERVNQIVADALDFFAKAPTKDSITKGTWFDYVSSGAKYEFDRDDENNLTISYKDNPGHWVHCGTRQNLKTDTTKDNKLTLKFRNEISEGIQVCLQATDDSGAYKLDSQIVNVKGNETKTIVLSYDIEICKLYFFVDSCDDNHHRAGKITILETSLSYEKREPIVIKDPKTVSIGQSMTKDDEGINTAYELTDVDTPFYIERVSAMVEVDYQGNGNSARYFGLHLNAASNKVSVSGSDGYGQDIKTGSTVTGGKFIFNLPISSKMSSGQTISMDISYAAGPSESHPEYNDLKFKVISYTFYYGLWKSAETETVDVNTEIYKNGSGSDGSGNVLTATIPYSAFTKTGRVQKMVVNFTTINNESYGKSQIYITNFPFTKFPSGNNNVLDIGSKMDTSKKGTEVASSFNVYPTESIDLKQEKEITIVCWWASATYIKINSITMYTDNIEPPSAVTSLEAHSIDKGVVLTWASAEGASQYEVYMDGELNQTVSTTYATVSGLENGVDHTFDVVAKNASGSAEKVSVIGKAEEGAQYDTFIEGLNTDFERELGSEKVGKVLTGSNYWVNSSNNERLKKTIAKMQNGEETTVAYMGGSITVGEGSGQYVDGDTRHQKGYAYYSYEWLKRNYDKQNKSKFINGSICGTGSEIGLVRAQKDILNYNPDLIFIEFAANNGSTEFDNSSYESLIKMCMNQSNDPAIVLVFSCTYYTNFESGTEKKLCDIGAHYSLPLFSFSRGMYEICNPKDKLNDPIFAKFTDDGTHPNNSGYQLYAKALAYFLRTLINRSTDAHVDYPETPSHTGYDRFSNMTVVDNTMNTEVIDSLGSFEACDTKTPSISKQSDVTAFQTGWKKTKTDENEPMVIKVNARNLVLINEAGNPSVAGDPTGMINVTVTNDNDPTDTYTLVWDASKTSKQNVSGDIHTIESKDNGWENPCGILILDEDIAGNYTISIKMDSNAGLCTIFAFGYCK